MGWVAVLLSLTLVGWLVAGRLQPRRGAERPLPGVTDWGALPSALRESSGLAVSRAHPGIFWSNNDSGDEPRVYALDSTAALLGTWDVDGASATDWEALDLGPCPGRDSGLQCLYAADVGDNGLERDTVSIWIVPEPDPDDPSRRVAALGQIRLSYPDGRHDTEAVAVTSRGDVVLVTKGRTPEIRLYMIPGGDALEALSDGRALVLASGTLLPIAPDWAAGRTITGGGFDPAGAVLALRTYTEVYFYQWPLDGAPTEAAESCFVGGLQRLGEAIAFLDAERILLSSESLGVAGHLLVIECAEAGSRR